MKRLLLIVVFLLCCALPAFATEITVGSSQWFPGAYRYPGTVATLRIYYSQSFLSNTNVNIIGSPVGSSAWYKQVSCIVTSNTLNCDSFTIQSTDDSNKPSTRFFAVLYDQAGARRDILMGGASGWKVPASPTSTTVAQLQNAQGTGIVNPLPSYLNASQVAVLIATAVGTLNTSAVGVLGRVEMSVPPADALHPVALGQNDASVVTLTGTQVLTNKTLTAPTIGSFANATHTHQNAVGGGQLALAAFSSATGSGAVVGAVSPTLTGTPTLPTGTIATTQSAGDSTTKLATTAFVTTADNLKADKASPTFTGTVTIPTPFTLGAVSVTPTGTELNFVDGVTSAIQTQLDAKAPLASPTFTGTPTLPTGTIGVTQGAGDSTTKLATTAFVTTADNLKANLASPTFTGTVTASTALKVANTGKLAVVPKTNDTYSAAMTIDVTISNHVIAASFTTSATVTMTPSAAGSAGDLLFITTETDGSGTVTTTFASTFHSSGTQATTASRFSTIVFMSDGTRWVEIARTTDLA